MQTSFVRPPANHSSRQCSQHLLFSRAEHCTSQTRRPRLLTDWPVWPIPAHQSQTRRISVRHGALGGDSSTLVALIWVLSRHSTAVWSDRRPASPGATRLYDGPIRPAMAEGGRAGESAGCWDSGPEYTAGGGGMPRHAETVPDIADVSVKKRGRSRSAARNQPGKIPDTDDVQCNTMVDKLSSHWLTSD